MSQTLPIDPFKIWKDIYEKTESTWSDTIQESLGKESFSEGLGQTLNGYLQYQEFVTKTAESYLTQLNMPSRDEVANVASLVINTENKIDNLEDQVEQVEQLAQDNTKEINSLKKTISNLDKKLDRILAEVEKDTTPAKKK